MNRIDRRLLANSAWTLGIGGLLLVAGVESSFAGGSVPELDPGSAVGGIALAITAALLLAERYRRRG